jgi:hypothetical protein
VSNVVYLNNVICKAVILSYIYKEKTKILFWGD